jgi:hypothetical protein
VVHYFTAEENRMLAHKVARVLKPGGIYAIGDLIRLQNPGAGNVVAATTGLYFALMSSSVTLSLEEIESWQSEAGLKPIKPIALMTLPGWKMPIPYK